MSRPARIVSLVPSLTELLFWLGAGDRVVGRTRFCEEPAGEVDRVPIVGGTKNPIIERILDLRPDLVLANKEENRREDVASLRGAGLNVLVTDPNTMEDAVTMVEEIGALLSLRERAASLAHATRREWRAPTIPSVRVFVAVWWNPLMGLGSASYGHDVLLRAGATNVLADRSRYPEVTVEELASLRPDLILLPDEPYPFKPAHAADFSAIASARIIDGKLLWWYGHRMPSALRELRTLLSEVSRTR